MRRGEVWWVSFDPSLGSEIRKTRPAVILSNDAANEALARVVVVPMTSNIANVYPGEALVMVENHQKKIMADHIMAADKRRLQSRLGTLSAQDMEKVAAALRLHLGLN
ncbi:MAG: type II toxin-antitoxin system PemK/MazF family toxin [Desulfovibrionaceae bacterium]|nr:type II toxin-antitoxin system PemK/MazF family toxin [Desulfovibrionaceae bacterium]